MASEYKLPFTAKQVEEKLRNATSQTDWAQTDETAVDFIKNKPFYEYEAQVDIRPLVEYNNFMLNSAFGIYYVDKVETYALTIGENYTVQWDGVEYNCTAQDGSALVSGAAVLGNLTAFGLSGNNEPFIIGNIGGQGSQYFSLVDAQAGGSHTIRIYQNVIVPKKIDQKYIPEIDLNRLPILQYVNQTVELLPTKTFEGFAIDSTYGMYAVTEQDPTYTLVAGETYIVEWDDVTYKCVGQDVSDTFGTPGCVAIGNGSIAGYPGNNEPFIIGKFNGAWKGYISLTDTAAGGSHTVRIYKLVDNPGYKIKEEYLPEFARRTMFEERSIEFDDFFDKRCSSLYNTPYSLVEGESYIVKFDGVEYEVTALLDEDSNCFILGSTANINVNKYPFGVAFESGIMMWLAFDGSLEHTCGLYKRASLFGETSEECSLPNVTNEDEGKILRVVNGSWAAIALPNAEEGGVSSWEDLTDKPFTYTEGEGTDLLPEQTLQFADMDDGSGMYNTVVQSAGRLLTAGETYAVIWDGVEYTFVCQTVSIGDEATEFIGNTALIGGEETADPMGIAQFVVALEDGTVVYIVTMVTPDTSESHTVALRTGGGGRWVLNESVLPMSAIDARIEEVISAALEGDY